MAKNRVDRARGLVKFVVIWLIALYVFEVVQQDRWFVGGGAVLVAAFVNVYARKKAADAVETNLTFHFWLYFPVALLFGLPLLFNAITIIASGENNTWRDHLVALLPFILKLGVPVAALIWVYVALGRAGAESSYDGAVPDGATGK
ncbi:MAG: hypothetical protein ACE5HE_12560 [Phycisphaerae bacterium]